MPSEKARLSSEVGKIAKKNIKRQKIIQPNEAATESLSRRIEMMIYKITVIAMMINGMLLILSFL